MPPTVRPISLEGVASIQIDDDVYDVIEIRATGDVVLDVSFENTSACTKSIPNDLLPAPRNSKFKLPGRSRIFFRVSMRTLTKNSKYFAHLLGSDVFGEGRAIKDAFSKFAEQNLKPSEIEAALLPRIKIVDEDYATRTSGRETVLRDMLRIIHGAEHITKTITINYLAVLVVQADRFDCLAPISRYVTTTFAKFKYPHTMNAAAEELLRQKILIFYHTNQAAQLATATKDLILRGSSRWNTSDEKPGFSTAWWDLPDGLEGML